MATVSYSFLPSRGDKAKPAFMMTSLSFFELTSSPVDAAALGERLATPDAGACVVFEGRVRNHHRGREVLRLEYEAYPRMAMREGKAILAEAERDFPGCRIGCVHRTGKLGLGETALWICVFSAHREAAFDACRVVLEAIKERLPVWKKEFYADGEAVWVNVTDEGITPSKSG